MSVTFKKSGDTIKPEPHITKSKTDSVTFWGHIEIKDKVFYGNDAVQDSSWILDATGKSRKGHFEAQYYYHEDLGFVYFYYDLGTEKIKIELLSSEF